MNHSLGKAFLAVSSLHLQYILLHYTIPQKKQTFPLDNLGIWGLFSYFLKRQKISHVWTEKYGECITGIYQRQEKKGIPHRTATKLKKKMVNNTVSGQNKIGTDSLLCWL